MNIHKCAIIIIVHAYVRKYIVSYYLVHIFSPNVMRKYFRIFLSIVLEF